jgi:GT2 family glycosyltransferase
VLTAEPGSASDQEFASASGSEEDPPVTAAPRVSILLVNWNTIEATIQCLDSLPTGIEGSLSTELIVVDNGSRDDSPRRLHARDDIVLLVNSHNLGFAAAVNQAYGRARGDLVLLLNSDIEFTPGSLTALVRFLDEHPDVAGVAPVYLNPDGSPQQHHFRLPTLGTVLANSSAVLRRLPPLRNRLREYQVDADGITAAQRVPQPSASCLLLRRSVLRAGRIFDERYPIFFNDVELAFELAEHGQELWVTPDAEVLHEGHASTRLLGGSLRRQYIGSLVRLLRETQPWYWLWLYRSLTFASGSASYLLRRPAALSPRELCLALAGNVGPLPDAPEGQPAEVGESPAVSEHAV